jgi:hypothetical protein
MSHGQSHRHVRISPLSSHPRAVHARPSARGFLNPTPCVIFATAAFAALPEHLSAIHVRLRAPLDWRIASYQREHLVDRRCAEKALKRSDHLNHAWVKTLYRVDVDDSRLFSVVVDASRFSPERVVEILLAAGGVHEAAQPAVAASSTM